MTVGYYIWKSMIPAALGNIVGGGLFVGVMYWYLFLAGNDVEIHFDHSPYDIAVYEQGGLGSRNPSVATAVPDSAGNAQSGLAKDLHAGLFKKERDSDNPNSNGSHA